MEKEGSNYELMFQSFKKRKTCDGFVDETVPLAVNCCGMQILKRKTTLRTVPWDGWITS